MTIQQLEYILAIEKHRHFVKAATACGITQSTLSSMIHKLEEELDIVIFDRNSHPIRPTMAGEQILKQAQIVLYHANQLKEFSLNERKRATGKIRLGITPTIAPYLMPKLFKYTMPMKELKLVVHELYRDRIVEMLKCAELDMAIMSMHQHDNNLLEIPLYKEELWAYVSPHDELYQMESIPFSELPYDKLWALRHEIRFHYEAPDLKNYEENRNATYKTGNMSTLVQIVDENNGFTVIPKLCISHLGETREKNVRKIINPTPTREVSIFVRNDYVQERLVNLIVDGIKGIVPREMIDERLQKYPVRL
ncbi:MAG: LysR substrate-binding domain-containing protein [Paludibacteraceae bacterium]|nr:LysR substrate-binding domain-containing protein [Paludibacteraceae bacterium]